MVNLKSDSFHDVLHQFLRLCEVQIMEHDRNYHDKKKELNNSEVFEIFRKILDLYKDQEQTINNEIENNPNNHFSKIIVKRSRIEGLYSRSNSTLTRKLTHIINNDYNLWNTVKFLEKENGGYIINPITRIIINYLFGESGLELELHELMLKSQLNEINNCSSLLRQKIPRPNWFFDIDVMVQPSFCVNEDLKFTRVSKKFQEEFQKNNKRVSFEGTSFINFIEERDFMVSEESEPGSEKSLKDKMLELFDDERPDINYLTIKSSGENNTDIIYDLFMTCQSRHIGLQGTIINSTLKHKEIKLPALLHSELLLELSHDFIQPISAITDNVILLKELITRHDYISTERLHGKVDRLTELVDPLLKQVKSWTDFYRKLMTRMENLNITVGEVVESSIDLVKFNNHRIDIDNKIHESVNNKLINKVAHLISGILISILKNSIRYAQNTSLVKIKIESSETNTDFSLIISDSGTEISYDNIKRIADCDISLQMGAYNKRLHGSQIGKLMYSRIKGGTRVELKLNNHKSKDE